MSQLIVESVGNVRLLNLPKTAFMCSRKVPAGIVLKCYDWAIEQREAGRCIISGFHSTIEMDVLFYLLKGSQPIIAALHRGIGKEIQKQFASYIDSGRLLVISPFDRSRTRGGSREARIRNKLMIDLAEDVVIGHATPGGGLAVLLEQIDKPVHFVAGKSV